MQPALHHDGRNSKFALKREDGFCGNVACTSPTGLAASENFFNGDLGHTRVGQAPPQEAQPLQRQQRQQNDKNGGATQCALTADHAPENKVRRKREVLLLFGVCVLYLACETSVKIADFKVIKSLKTPQTLDVVIGVESILLSLLLAGLSDLWSAWTTCRRGRRTSQKILDHCTQHCGVHNPSSETRPDVEQQGTVSATTMRTGTKSAEEFSTSEEIPLLTSEENVNDPGSRDLENPANTDPLRDGAKSGYVAVPVAAVLSDEQQNVPVPNSRIRNAASRGIIEETRTSRTSTNYSFSTCFSWHDGIAPFMWVAVAFAIYNGLEKMQLLAMQSPGTVAVVSRVKILFVVAGSALFLGRKFRPLQYVSVALVILGIIWWSFAKAAWDRQNRGQGISIAGNSTSSSVSQGLYVFGLALALTGSICVAAARLSSERNLKEKAATPFYVQKFHLELPCLLFAIVWLFVIPEFWLLFLDEATAKQLRVRRISSWNELVGGWTASTDGANADSFSAWKLHASVILRLAVHWIGDLVVKRASSVVRMMLQCQIPILTFWLGDVLCLGGGGGINLNGGQWVAFILCSFLIVAGGIGFAVFAPQEKSLHKK
ncbi:unnamed protein product [Amoebophrya sp. A25]|nr:unnamed protein product [Amoebophrya sp. A25]|eukprot:GSA25T00012023001.1